MLSVYGAAVMPAGRSLDYAGWVGLHLNLPRVRLQHATALAQAMGAAGSNEPLSRDWADAVAPDPALVDEVLYQANAARQDARVKSKLGWND